MHFGLRELAAAISAAALIFCCSCEKHRLGEDPEVQKENIGAAEVSTEEASGEAKESAPGPSATTSPTPAQFFPENSPSS